MAAVTHRFHASCVQLDHGYSILITGPSGAGKSTLSLMLIERFMAALIADDQTIVSATETGQLIPSCPPEIGGLLEVRGVGLVPYPPPIAVKPLGLVIDLAVADGDKGARLPDATSWACEGITVPLFHLGPLENSTADRVLAAYRLTLAGKAAQSIGVDCS